jgi:hypothetical protein
MAYPAAAPIAPAPSHIHISDGFGSFLPGFTNHDFQSEKGSLFWSIM